MYDLNLKCLQTELLQLLCDFDALCREHGISYTLQGGTLLGAVREHGFIPWDDDADIAMTRNNYHKLISVLENTSTDFEIQGNLKKQFRRRGKGTAWVDIFIFDYITEHRIAQKSKLLILTALDIMNRDRNTVFMSDIAKYSRLKQWAFKLFYVVGCFVPKRWKVMLYTSVAEKGFLGSKKYIFKSNDQYKARSMVIPEEWISEYLYVPFEDCMLPIMKEYHLMLSGWYGDDYMTPVKEARNSQLHERIRSGADFQL